VGYVNKFVCITTQKPPELLKNFFSGKSYLFAFQQSLQAFLISSDIVKAEEARSILLADSI
jgi:hypothetical protein